MSFNLSEIKGIPAIVEHIGKGNRRFKPKIDKEFNLSDKIFRHPDFPFQKDARFIYIKDVKEFIRLEFQLILMLHERKITLDKFIERRSELAGGLDKFEKIDKLAGFVVDNKDEVKK